jgi:hypothetical protein
MKFPASFEVYNKMFIDVLSFRLRTILDKGSRSQRTCGFHGRTSKNHRFFGSSLIKF